MPQRLHHLPNKPTSIIYIFLLFCFFRHTNDFSLTAPRPFYLVLSPSFVLSTLFFFMTLNTVNQRYLILVDGRFPRSFRLICTDQYIIENCQHSREMLTCLGTPNSGCHDPKLGQLALLGSVVFQINI